MKKHALTLLLSIPLLLGLFPFHAHAASMDTELKNISISLESGYASIGTFVGKNTWYLVAPDGDGFSTATCSLQALVSPEATLSIPGLNLSATANEYGQALLEDVPLYQLKSIVVASANGLESETYPIVIYPTFFSGFKDVEIGRWYFDAVRYVGASGLFTGTSASTFSPNAPMTRAAFMQVLANRTEGYNKDAYGGKSVFPDVPIDYWGCAAIHWAYKNNVTSGTAETAFSPEKGLTREQLVTFLYRYAQRTGVDTTASGSKYNAFPDKNSVSSWAREAMRWAVNHGIINGINGYLRPQDITTRAQVATAFMNAQGILSSYTLTPQEEQADPAIGGPSAPPTP